MITNNAIFQQLSTILDDNTSIKAIRNGSYTIVDSNFIDYDKTYIGEENPLVLKRFYNTIFDCKYDMAWYPFDNQKCSLVFQMTEDALPFVNLEGDRVEYSGPTDLMLYFIKKIIIRQCSFNEVESACVDFILKRRLLRYDFKTLM